jgi:hypothetical protein
MAIQRGRWIRFLAGPLRICCDELMWRGLLPTLVLSMALAPLAQAQRLGVIDDSKGANLRADKNADSAVVATVKPDEPFAFEREKDAEWAKVTLASGPTGWIELSRIRLHFTEKDLPSSEKDPAGESEIEQFARTRGFQYAAGTRRAARGDVKALKEFFTIAQKADGAAAESITGVPTVVYHLLGDEKFAKFLAAQPVPYRMMVRNEILGDGVLPPVSLYLRSHFPATARTLFRLEMVDWPSPNDLYAVRKVFSHEFELGGSKVVRAELIEKKTGRVLCDLTPDDIGTGAQREGEAFWSPDSKRVACLSTDFSQEQGSLFSTPRPAPHRKLTSVYQLTGDSFAKVNFDLSQVPGRKADKELERAILGHVYTEPLRWLKPNVLLLQHHEYYETLRPIPDSDSKLESIHPFDRLYHITVTIDADKAAVSWKLRTNRP